MSAGTPDARALARYRQALERSNQLIEPILPDLDESLAAVDQRARVRLDRLRRFLDRHENPHRRYPVIHVTGTSGKGSTCIAIAAILGAAGNKVGLYTSPYLQAATEKLQIGGRLIAPNEFADLVDDLLERVAGWGEGPLSYAEFWFALAALSFLKNQVDVAVIEVGAGGRLDVTNLVQPAVSVITSIGLDHTETLGSTIADIAWHKAGIVKPGAPVVTAVSDPEALAAIEGEASRVGAEVSQVLAGRDYEIVETGVTSTQWRDAQGRIFPTGMLGRFQTGNAALAVAAVERLRGVAVSDDAISAGLTSARLPGRFEIVQREPLIVLDGAHNPEKIAALAAELPALVRNQGLLIAVVGALAAKDHLAIVRAIASEVDSLILTSPRVLAKPSAAAADLARDARSAGFRGLIEVTPNPKTALDQALELARPEDVILVTGSLYLLGNLRGRWFPDDEIVLQQTSWPVTHR